MQTDRNAFNINFLYDKKTKTYTLAPLFDNEFAFFGERLANWVVEKNVVNYDLDHLILQHSREDKIFTFDLGYFASYKKVSNNIENLVLYGRKHPLLGKILADTLNKIDIKTAILKLKEKNISAGEEYAEFVTKVIEDAKEKILKANKTTIARDILKDCEKLY